MQLITECAKYPSNRRGNFLSHFSTINDQFPNTGAHDLSTATNPTDVLTTIYFDFYHSDRSLNYLDLIRFLFVKNHIELFLL